jgi:phospholipid-binding lipoprotein MlaA
MGECSAAKAEGAPHALYLTAEDAQSAGAQSGSAQKDAAQSSVMVAGAPPPEAVRPPAVAAPAPIPDSPTSPPATEPPPTSPLLTDPLAPPAGTETTPKPGEIIVTGAKHQKNDPAMAINMAVFNVSEKLDGSLILPVTNAYKHHVPEPVRDGVHNLLSNLHEPVVAASYLLELKPWRAVKTLARFAINTTVGVGGLFDIAKHKPFRLHHHNNGFADVLGFYGVKPGPYIYLPIIGATTPRDFFGRVVDGAALPIMFNQAIQFGTTTHIVLKHNRLKLKTKANGRSSAVKLKAAQASYTLPAAVLRVLDHRLLFDAELLNIRTYGNPYAARRTYYFQQRALEIDALRHPEKYPDPQEDDWDTDTPSAENGDAAGEEPRPSALGGLEP